ncbi:tlde1 domain-containing protein [Buttiauxella agrestis]|uniref:tlde1 domain-containing protein n=1 Tax=Buttiauxella agrestis TaxID=82977 RepID=UPI003974AB7F
MNGCFMWVYSVSSGTLSRNEERISGGYAGLGAHKNDSSFECSKDSGPLPRGRYRIGQPFFHPRTKGYTMRLIPDSSNIMCDRDGFMIHGDSIRHPGQASNGCIIFPLKVRKHIWESNDHELEVR